MLKPVLVILTLHGNATHLALSDADSAEDCATKAEVVGQILKGAGQEVLAVGCGQTDLVYTPYSHGAPETAYVHPWRVKLSEGGPVIEALPDGAACTPEPRLMQPTYCALSAQTAR